MEEDNIRCLFEEVDPEGKIPQSKIEEFIASVKNLGQPTSENKVTGNEIAMIKGQLETETDWRKRASLAAKLISLNLE